LATFTLKVTVLAPPAFLMTNLYSPSFVGVTLTEHFGPGRVVLSDFRAGGVVDEKVHVGILQAVRSGLELFPRRDG
jgi:hypothetical protein